MVKKENGVWLFTADTMLEGVHFLRHFPPEAIGWKIVSVSVSDVAAKGGRPLYATITLGVDPNEELRRLEEIYRGVAKALSFYKASLLGGNTVRSERLCLDMAVVGEAPRPVFRDAPRPGDGIFVSGTLGDSRAGLELLLSKKERLKDYEKKLVERHLRPRARTDLAPIVAARASASMDVSDGLLSDLKKMFKKTGARIDLSKIPTSPELELFCRERGLDPKLYAAVGGEDYELLVTSQEDLEPFGFTKIGEATEEGGILSADGSPLPAAGFDHLTPDQRGSFRAP